MGPVPNGSDDDPENMFSGNDEILTLDENDADPGIAYLNYTVHSCIP